MQEPPKKVILTRLFNATPERLFSCFTDAKLLAKWWGPANWTNPICKFEPKVGGKIYVVMRGQMGPGGPMTDAPMTGTVLEIDPPKKLVFSSQALFGNDPTPQIEAIGTITFTKKGNQTLLTVVEEVKMVKPQALMALAGMEAGWSQSLDKLATLSEDTQEREIVITRQIQAPIAKVWKAITDPKQVVKWWGPNGFTNTIEKMEVKVGGVWALTMHAPDGTVYPNYSVFTEVVPERRLSFDHGSDPSLKGHFKSSITLAPMGEMTFLTLRSVFETKEVRDWTVKTVKAIEGGNQTLNRLEEYLKTNGGDDMVTPLKEFVISRVFNAPRERVWKAWTDAKEADKWFGPKGTTIVQSKGEIKAGSARLIAMKGPDGRIMWGKAVYKEMVPPAKLVWVNSFSDETGGLTRHPMAPTWPLEMLTTVELEEAGPDKTKLTIRWLPIHSTEEENKTFMAGFDSMTGGWSGTFENLESYLAKAKK